MNAFVEHHKNSLQFGYRGLDRMRLNGWRQPFQPRERGLGFFNSDRQGKRVTRRCLTEIADPFQYGLKNRTEKWGVPLLMLPRAMTTRAGETSSWSNISGCQTPPGGGDP